MANYLCYKGFLLAPSPTDGTMVPFFVNVRDKDIIWDVSSLPASIQELAEKGKNITVQGPATEISFTYNGWTLKLRSDFTYTAIRKLSIGYDDFVLDPDDNSDMSIDVQFPFSTKNNNELNVQCTMNGFNDDLATASINVILDNNIGESIKKMTIHLRNLICKFDENFKDMKSYLDSSLYLSISGKMDTILV